MNRRSNQVRGFVKFPVQDQRFTNTGEGGMFVRLVVVDPAKGKDEDWMVCCGGYQCVTRDECVCDEEADKFHFPDQDPSSISYLNITTLGSTGWSGWDKAKECYWRCSYEDLTEEGKRLYDLIKSLYQGCDLYLQTWLDT